METLILILLKHQVGVTTYISKNTMEVDLKSVGISLVERCSSSSRVVTLLLTFAERNLASFAYAFAHITNIQKNKKSPRDTSEDSINLLTAPT